MTQSLVVRPRDCLIGFGVPLSEEDFRTQAADAQHHDFIKSQQLSWEKYRFLFADTCRTVRQYLKDQDVKIIQRMTLAALSAAFSNPPKVVILFAHWSDEDGTVELADGIVSSEKIVAIIPQDFFGLLDLCVCHPAALVKLAKQLRPNCLVKYTSRNASPLVWIYAYQALFKILSENPTDYVDALTSAFHKFIFAEDQDEAIK